MTIKTKINVFAVECCLETTLVAYKMNSCRLERNVEAYLIGKWPNMAEMRH